MPPQSHHLPPEAPTRHANDLRRAGGRSTHSTLDLILLAPEAQKMTTRTQWAWDVPLSHDNAHTRVVLLALAEFAAPVIPGSHSPSRLGVVDPTHPDIAATAGMTVDEVARHVAALTRADVLVAAPSGPLVRFNEDITASSTSVAKIVSETLTVLPDVVPSPPAGPTTESPAEETTEQAALIDVPAKTPQRPTTKRAAKQETPEQITTKEIMRWWWDHWTHAVGPISNPPAFNAHAKRIVSAMLAEGHPPAAIKDAFVHVDQPKPPEWLIRNFLRGKSRRPSAESHVATRSLPTATAPVDPFQRAAAGGR